MSIVKEIQVTKIVIDESKIKVGDKVLYKYRSFYDEDNKDYWEDECDCIITDIFEDDIYVDDLGYPGHKYKIRAKDIESGMFHSIEIIK